MALSDSDSRAKII